MLKSNYTQRFPPLEILELETLNDKEYECAPSYEMTLVIPTRNEAGNIESLLLQVQQAVKGIEMEVVFVDDSRDETPVVIEKLREWFPNTSTSTKTGREMQ